MALLGGGPRKRLTKRGIRDLKTRVRLTGKAREAPLKTAGIPGKAIFKLLGPVARRLGKKIPLVKRIIPGSPERAAKLEKAISGLSGVTRPLGKFRGAPAPRGGFKPRAIAKTTGKLVVAGVALEAGTQALQAILPSPVIPVRPAGGVTSLDFPFRGGGPMAHPGIGSGGGGLVLGGQAPPGSTIVKVWDTGTARFARDASGMHYVLKKDGTIKRFRPPRPVCVPKKWDSRSMSRVMRRLGSHQKAAIKLVQMMGGSASKTKHTHRG